MFSMPPATAMSTSPSAMALAAKWMAFIPEEHTLLTVVQGTVSGMPAAMAACLAGACPIPAERTLPMKTSWMSGAESPAESMAAVMAAAPSCGAGTDDKAPRKDPIGVRRADTITTALLISDN